MPVTMLDPDTALIVIDLQKGLLGLPTVHSTDSVVAKAAALADVFRKRRLPVVLVNVDGRPPGRTEQAFNAAAMPADWADLTPALNPQPGDHRITKRSWSAFQNTTLLDILQRHAVTQIVLAGIATSGGVESTARHARDLGFHVTLATDAMTDTRAELHDNSTARVFPRLGETGTTQQIVDLLQQGTPL